MLIVRLVLWLLQLLGGRYLQRRSQSRPELVGSIEVYDVLCPFADADVGSCFVHYFVVVYFGGGLGDFLTPERLSSGLDKVRRAVQRHNGLCFQLWFIGMSVKPCPKILRLMSIWPYYIRRVKHSAHTPHV
jgi:hypothetical protein